MDEVDREINSNIEIIEKYQSQDPFNPVMTENDFMKAIWSLEEITEIHSLAEINWFVGYLRDDTLRTDIKKWREWQIKRHLPPTKN